MASRDSWIDPEEVSELAGEVYPEGEKPQEPEDEFSPLPLLDDDDLSAAGDALDADEAEAGDEDDEQGTLQRMGERLQLIRERALRSGLLVGTEAEEAPVSEEPADEPTGEKEFVPEPFVLPSGRLVEQAQALVDWLSGACEQVFVLDELGDELVAGDVPAGLRSGAVRLAQSWERSQRWLREEDLAAETPLVSAMLADGSVLSVVGVRCATGFYCAALVGKRMVSAAHAARIQEALFLVFG